MFGTELLIRTSVFQRQGLQDCLLLALGCRHRNPTVDQRESSEEGRQGAEEHLEDQREEAALQEGVVRHLHLQGAEAGAPNAGISSKTKLVMNSFVNDIFERIAAEASRLLFTR